MKNIEEIIEAIKQQGDELSNGNSKVANKLNDIILKDLENFIDREGAVALLPWLMDENLNVKTWIAKSVYSSYPDRAVAIFKEVEKSNTIFAGSAFLFLDMHSKGIL